MGIFNPDWNERSVFINGNGGDLISDFHCPNFLVANSTTMDNQSPEYVAGANRDL